MITGYVNGDAPSVVSGSASLTTTATAASSVGSYAISAALGNLSATNYAFTFAPGTLTVSQAPTSVVVTASPNPVLTGQTVTFTATISASPNTESGTVTFYDGAFNLGTGTVSSGVATLSTSALGVGSHTITASYGGDGNFSASASLAITETVNPAAASIYLLSGNAAGALTLSGNAQIKLPGVVYVDSTRLRPSSPAATPSCPPAPSRSSARLRSAATPSSAPPP